MTDDFVPAPSLDSHTMPMDVKVPLIPPPLNSDGQDEDLPQSNAVLSPLTTDTRVHQRNPSPSHNVQLRSSLNEPKPLDKYFNANQIKNVSFYQSLLSEYLGTLLLVLICTSTGLPIASKSVPDLNGALVSGFTVATLIVGFGHTSGAHINPAVTVTFLVVGEIDILRALCYIVSQLLGAISASSLLRYLAPSSAQGQLGMTLVTPGISLFQACLVELIITFILCHTVHAICDKRRDDIGGSKALVVGLAVTINCLFAGPYSGAAMNPARAFGPAVVMNSWINHWVYWIGPLSGAILAGLVYTFVLKQKYPMVTLRDSMINLPNANHI